MPPEALLPPEQVPMPPATPEMEALLTQNERHHEETAGLLDTIIHQGEKNNPEPLLDTMIEQNESTKEAIHANGSKIEKAIETIKPSIQETVASVVTAIEMVKKLEMHKGDKGEKGEKGDRGADGMDGDEGDRGPTGPVGPEGPQGPQGDQGAQGEKGERGDDGATGPQGQTGPAGAKGTDGSPDTGVEIVTKLSELPEAQRLSYNFLKDTPAIFRDPRHQSSRDYSFLELTDTPKSYSGQAGKRLRVNATATGIEFADDSEVVSAIRLLLNDVTTNLYVATTGSDTANTGLTAASPFLTVQRAIDYIAAGLWPGIVQINVADGTYVGNMIAKEILGKSSATITLATATPVGPSLVKIVGNVTTPDNVVLQGNDALLATFVMENVGTTYSLDGMNVRGTSGTKAAFFVSGQKSTLLVNNINTQTTAGVISCHFGARFCLLNGTAGGTHAMTSGNFIFQGNASYVRIDRGVTVTGLTLAAWSATRASICIWNTTGQTYTFTTSTVSGAAVFSSSAAFMSGFGSGDVININKRSNPVFLCAGLGFQGNMLIQGPATFNLTDCTGGVARFQNGSVYAENNACTWNYLGTSVATYIMFDAAQMQGLNNFTSAVPSFSVQDTDYKFGYDWRYVTTTRGTVPGALLVAGTGFFKPQGTQVTNYVPLYIAQQDEIVDKLQMVSRVGNGAAHTDTYTVYKNGVATTMVLTITNAASGNTIVNPVTLAAGDTLAILVTVDVATAAEDVLVQLNIRKT